MENNIQHSMQAFIKDTELDIIEGTSGHKTLTLLDAGEVEALHLFYLNNLLFRNLLNNCNIETPLQSLRPFMMGFYNVRICAPAHHCRVVSKEGSNLSKMYAKLQTLRY